MAAVLVGFRRSSNAAMSAAGPHALCIAKAEVSKIDQAAWELCYRMLAIFQMHPLSASEFRDAPPPKVLGSAAASSSVAVWTFGPEEGPVPIYS